MKNNAVNAGLEVRKIAAVEIVDYGYCVGMVARQMPHEIVADKSGAASHQYSFAVNAGSRGTIACWWIIFFGGM